MCTDLIKTRKDDSKHPLNLLICLSSFLVHVASGKTVSRIPLGLESLQVAARLIFAAFRVRGVHNSFSFKKDDLCNAAADNERNRKAAAIVCDFFKVRGKSF